MRKIGLLFLICFFICGCSFTNLREEAVPKREVVRIYDVISQDRDEIYISYTNNEEYNRKLDEALHNITFSQHLVRTGIFTSIGDNQSEAVPYKNQISEIKLDSGVDEIEYIVLGSWDELDIEIKKNQQENITNIVIFDNSYTGSLLKEASSGKYVDLESSLAKVGMYNSEKYEQTVLEAGYVDGGQIFVPLLYNVSGMIHGKRFSFDEMGNVIEPDTIDGKGLSFDEFIDELGRVMMLNDNEAKDMAYFSSGFLDGEIDLYLTASGVVWNNYEEQYELFATLYYYLNLYKEAQVYSQSSETSMQEMYAMCLNLAEFKSDRDIGLGEDLVEKLGIVSKVEGLAAEDSAYTELCRWTLEKTYYFVETTSYETVPYHSILGLLAYRNYYCNVKLPNGALEPVYTGEMGYWPIGVWKNSEQYAAQPICYAAVLEGGNTETASKVIKAMLNQDIAVQFGLSVNNEVREEQINEWESSYDSFGGVRNLKLSYDGDEFFESWSEIKPYWNSVICGNSGWLEDKAEYTSQLRQQLDNVVVAQIADREILAIWQDTLIETIDSEISKEQGFEILCERIDQWYAN